MNQILNSKCLVDFLTYYWSKITTSILVISAFFFVESNQTRKIKGDNPQKLAFLLQNEVKKNICDKYYDLS